MRSKLRWLILVAVLGLTIAGGTSNPEETKAVWNGTKDFAAWSWTALNMNATVSQALDSLPDVTTSQAVLTLAGILLLVTSPFSARYAWKLWDNRGGGQDARDKTELQAKLDEAREGLNEKNVQIARLEEKLKAAQQQLEHEQERASEIDEKLALLQEDNQVSSRELLNMLVHKRRKQIAEESGDTHLSRHTPRIPLEHRPM